MATRRKLRAQLRRYLTQPGNWRLKALVLGMQESQRAVGEAWPVEASERRTLQQYADGPTPAAEARYSLAHEPGSRELAAVRSGDEFSNDEVRELQQGHGLDRDEYISRLLVSETEVELDVVWREELTETVVMGAASRKAWRDAATVTEVNAKKGDLPTEGTETFASTGAQAGGAEFDEVDYHASAYDCEVHEHGFALTDELVDMASPSLVEEHVRKAGRAVENAINRQAINEFLDNATNYDADLSGSGNTDLRDLLLKASEAAADNDFDPTNVVVGHPEYWSELGGNNPLAGLNVLRSDVAGEDHVSGHEPYVMSGSAYDSGSTTYGFEADGEHGALVFGREFVHIPVYQDTVVSELEPPFTAIHDLQGGVARAWTDAVAVDEDADGTYESVIRVQR